VRLHDDKVATAASNAYSFFRVTGLNSVILSTFDQPKHLERVLWGYVRQTDRDLEIMSAWYAMACVPSRVACGCRWRT
jgi:hypothetical protein